MLLKIILISLTILQSYFVFSQDKMALFNPNDNIYSFVNVNIQNVFLPGFGTSIVHQKKYDKFVAVGFYGTAATGLYFLRQSSAYVDAYKKSETFEKAEKGYEGAISSRKLGYTLLGVSAAIWVTEIVRGNIILTRENKRIKNYKNEFLSFNVYPTIDQLTNKNQLNLQLRMKF